MTVTRSGDPAARVVMTAGSQPHAVIVDIRRDPAADARLIIGAQQLAAPGYVMRTLYGVLHAIFSGGELI